MGTFDYISIIAMSCYAFMLLTFLAAKRNKLVNSFLIVLVGLLFWTGGSVFMRMELWPGHVFWFQVSLCGILMLPYAYSRFVYAFGGIKEEFQDRLWMLVMLLLFVVNIPRGVFLKYPEMVERNGGLYFEYEIDIKVTVFFVVAAITLVRTFGRIIKVCKKNQNMSHQYKPVVLGMMSLFLGNLLLSIPFFTGFPIDILGGLVNACFLMYALIRKRLFQLQMLASSELCYGVGLIFSLVLFFNLSPYLYQWIPMDNKYYAVAFSILFLLTYLGISFLWKALANTLFIKEELQQADKLKQFSSGVSKTLNLNEIMDRTIQVIGDTITAESIYIFIQETPGGSYRGMYSNKPLSDLSFSLEETNPLVQWLTENDEPLLYRDFRYTVGYKSMWEREKYQLEKMGIQSLSGLKDDNQLIGIIFLAGQKSKGRVGYNDLQMLSSVTSVASIAIKNARLYEKACMEARTDEMTGLLNRKYFYEILNREFKKNKEGSLALMILNVDDFNLYNQLYGVREGDQALVRIAEIIRSTVGDNGFSGRYSGKEFAILLPRYDVFSAKNLAESLSRQIYSMNDRLRAQKLKAITVSVGISAAPYAAKSVKELMENVDMAVYHVKHNGKNGIQVFDSMFRYGLDRERTDHAHIYQEYGATIYALTAAIDAKDHYTFSHSNNVAYYATSLAKKLGMNEDVVEIIRQSALLHDVGKIGIAESVLNKEGKLTDEEYEIIKGHVEASIDIIRHLPSLDYVIPAVIGHHERYDGKGYPRRIAGEDIPVTARILCIADSFDAMTSKRCYKKAMSVERAKNILREEAGRQFDPNLAEAFIRCLDEGVIKLVTGEYSGKPEA